MPSPIGHALGGIAAAWAAAPRRNVNAAILSTVAALAPDLDLLVGDHRGISHSIGAAVVAGLVAGALWSSAFAPAALPPSRRWRVGGTGRGDALRGALMVTIAWASHIALDWLSNDTRPPIGVMALWPFTRDYYKAAIEIFPAVSRQCCGRRFWIYNIRAVVVECLILAPLMILAVRSLRRK